MTFHRSQYSRSVPYLRVANVFRDRLDLTEVKQMNVTDSELERTRLLEGDVLIVEGHGNPSEIGRSAVWDGSIAVCTHQNHLIRVRPDRRLCDPAYISAFLNSLGGRRQLIKAGKTTSGLNTISSRNVKEVMVMIPPVDSQRRFAAIVRSANSCRRSMVTMSTVFHGLVGSLSESAFRKQV